METDLPSCFFYSIFRTTPEVSIKIYFVKIYVKSQRSYGFLITKDLIFGFQILDLKVHCSASLTETVYHFGDRVVFEQV